MIKERQTVETNFDGMEAHFIEPVINTEASEFIVSHIDEIRRQVRKMGLSPDKVDELINDVWLSIHDAEQNGNGYDVSRSNEGDIITVEEFVYGRIKGYSMNSRYRNDIFERKVSRDSSRSVEIISASSTDASDLDNLDGFQKAYALAASYDDIGNIEAEISLRSNIVFCMDFDSTVGFSLLNFFRHMDEFATIGFNSSLFDKLKEAVKYHDEFAVAFRDVMEIAQTRKPVFDMVLSSF